MAFFRKAREEAEVGSTGKRGAFHPSTTLCDWGHGGTFDIAAAKTGTLILGATGSGKTSGPARNIAFGLLQGGCGGLVLCAKPEEAAQWQGWAADAGRGQDIIDINESGEYRYNFLAEEAARASDGGGLTLNITALLSEVAGAVSKGAGKSGEDGGDDKFWSDSLTHLLTNLIDLCVLSRQSVTLPRLRELANSAPLSLEQVGSQEFCKNSECCKAIVEAININQGDEFAYVNVKECASYFLQEWPGLSDKTRSVIQLTLSMLMRPFLTRPLYRIFSTDTNVRPEDTFSGKIIIVNLPVQTYKNAGIFAGILMKYVTQLAVMRRSEPKNGSFLRPVFIWSDEAQNFISDFDYTYQAVARSAGGCTCYIVQSRETLLAAIGNEYKVDSLLSNLQTKIFCQNTGKSNTWASELFGERWEDITTTSVNRSGQEVSSNSGVSISQQRRAYVEPSRFTTLKRGGFGADFKVETIIYKGGHVFSDGMPFRLLAFDQR